jgi:ParB family chromosome partitioning protein
MSPTIRAASDLLAEGDLIHAGFAPDARDLLLDEIVPDPLQPRRHFDTAELQSLADDIARRGVLQPILVRPGEKPGEAYRLVSGERRWRAARIAGKVRIPVRVRELSDDEVRAAQLAENVLRAELTDIEKGRALRSLYDIRKSLQPKTTWEDVAQEVGLGRARIHDLFQLASLPESIGQLIEAGRLSGSHGIALQRAKEMLSEEEMTALAEQAARPSDRRQGGYNWSVAYLRRHIQEYDPAVKKPIPSEAPVGEETAAETDILPAPKAETLPALETDRWEPESVASFTKLRPAVAEVLRLLAEESLTVEEQSLLTAALMPKRPDAASEPLPPGESSGENRTPKSEGGKR